MLSTIQALLSQSLPLIEGTNKQEIMRVWEAQWKLKCFPSQKGFSPPTHQSKSCLGPLSSQGFLDLEQTPRHPDTLVTQILVPSGLVSGPSLWSLREWWEGRTLCLHSWSLWPADSTKPMWGVSHVCPALSALLPGPQHPWRWAF